MNYLAERNTRLPRLLQVAGRCAFGALFLAYVGCSAEPPVSSGSERVATDALTRIEADARARRLADLRYEVSIDLTTGARSFAGETRISFELSDANIPLTVDFSGGEDLTVTLNGKVLNLPYNGYFLTLPVTALHEGGNVLTVSYLHPYGRDGTGLHRFTDPEDGLTYLYTYLWPYYANRLLPLFDQPNLKARYTLDVKAPDGWEVVSTSSGVVESSGDGTANWRFPETPPISSYVFSLHAGPYQIWQDRAADIPLRLLARQSLASHVAVREWFEVTRNGLEFYARYFEVDYPFGKYDQLIVPDFNIGAMENIAAVTFGEHYVQREKSSHSERESRADVILHEMAHMWFGNLVTHEWWNGLWLNESFATQMANIALTETTAFTDAWHRFFTEDKQAAYHRDSRVTTHPIEMPIASTADFFTVFDAITYEKGSSVLRQLAHLVGEEQYRQGVAAYLLAHAYDTTELTDFIEAQARSAQRSLAQWSDQWLSTAGFNTLEPSFVCTDDRLTELTIKQSSSQSSSESSVFAPTLRTHQLDVALFYDAADGALQVGVVLGVEVAGETTDVVVPAGTPCPVLVFPNHHDWAYAKPLLPEASVRAFVGRIDEVDDPLARSALLVVLIDRAHDGDMLLQAFLRHLIDSARTEPNFRVLSQLVRELTEFVALLERLSPEADELLDRLGGELETLAWDKAQTEMSDEKLLWIDLYINVARSADGLNRLRSLLDGDESIDGLPLSQDKRWQILVRLAAYGIVEEQIVTELKTDPSDRGEKMAIAARAAQPDLGIKLDWLEEIQNPKSTMGLAEKRFAIYNLVPPNQALLGLKLLEEILSPLNELSQHSDHYFISHYVRGLLGNTCRSEGVNKMAIHLDEPEGLSSTALRFLREAHQADSECAALRTKF